MKKRLHPLILLLVPVLFLSCARQMGTHTPGRQLIIYPPPPDTTRIQYLTSFSNSLEITGKRDFFSRFVLGEKEAVPVIKPYGIATAKGKLYICDPGVAGLELVDLEEKTFEYFIPRGWGQFKMPVNCCLDEKLNLYVADVGRKQVIVFNDRGEYLDAFGEPGDTRPTDVAVNGGLIWVPDAAGFRINVYDQETRKKLFHFPDSLEEGDGRLYQPVNLTVAGEKIYVTDFGDFRIKIYDLNGEFLQAIGSYGNTPGQFVRPKGTSVDRDGILYAVDAGFENVQLFNDEGRLLMHFGGPYKGPGDLWLPAKVTIDYDNLGYFQQFVNPGFKLKYLILVTNQYGPAKVNIYGALETENTQQP